MTYGLTDLQDIIRSLLTRVRNLELSTYSYGAQPDVTPSALTITGLAGVITYYTEPETGLPKASVLWSWSAPAATEDDPVVDYMVSLTRSTDAATGSFSGTKGATSATAANLPIGVNQTARVYAVTQKGVIGPTASATVTVVKNSSPPPQPAAPTVTAGTKSVTVTSNGKDASNAAMPIDVKYYEVHYATTGATFTPSTSTYFTTIAPAGSTVIMGNSNYDTIYVRLIAVNQANLKSAASTAGSATPIKTINTDMDVVLPGMTPYSDVNNLIIDGSFENSGLRLLRDTLSHADYSQDTTAGIPYHGSTAIKFVSTSTGDKTFYVNTRNASYLSSQIAPITVMPGSKLYFKTLVRHTGASGSFTFVVQVRYNNGTLTTYTKAVTAASITSGTWSPVEFVYTIPALAADIVVYYTLNSIGTWYIDAAEARLVMSSVLIDDAAITNAKIADLAVDNAKIAGLAASKITTGELQAGNKIIAGDAGGTHAELDSSGFKTYVYDPDSATLSEAIRLGVAGLDDVFHIKDADGDTVASITSAGRIIGSSVEVPELSPTTGLYVYGMEFSEHLANLPQGIVGWTKLTAHSSNSTGSEVIVLELRTMLRPNRLYRLRVPSHYINADATNDQLLEQTIRYATGGADVTTASTILDWHTVLMDTLSNFDCPAIEVIVPTDGLTEDTEYRFIYTIKNATGTNVMNVPLRANSPTEMYIEDVGPYVSASGAIMTRVSVWEANQTMAYNSDGSNRTDEAYAGYGGPNPITVGDCYGADNNNYSIAIFNSVAISGETTSTIDTALTGATILKAELYVHCAYAESTYGLDLDVRTHTLTTLMNTVPTGTAVTKNDISEGSGKWINITSIWDTTKRGVWYGPGATMAASYHGHIRGADAGSGRPRLRITYRR